MSNRVWLNGSVLPTDKAGLKVGCSLLEAVCGRKALIPGALRSTNSSSKKGCITFDAFKTKHVQWPIVETSALMSQ